MTSITYQKNEHRNWISAYWARYSQTLSLIEARDLVLWLVRKLSDQMTLAQLEEWRGKLEAREEKGELPPAILGECIWKETYWEDCWETSCGNAWSLNEGKPSENSMRFCLYCGKPLVEVLLLDELSEEN